MISIRRADSTDLEFIKEMYKLLDVTMMDLYNKLVVSYEKNSDDMHVDEYWMNLIEEKNGYILIAQEEYKRVGISVVENVDRYEVHLEDLIILPEFRGKGIANLLIRKSKEIALKKAYKRITLNVLENNDIAKKLYEKEDFKNVKISMVCTL